MPEFHYRGYGIEVEAQALASGKWVPHAVVCDGDRNRLQVFPMTDGRNREFALREAAETLALELAQAWIDRREDA